MTSTALDLSKEIEAHAAKINELREQVAKVIVGQRYMIDRIIMALIADGHILIEGVPGLAKTTAIKCVSDAIRTGFS
ncbi:MAG: ATPase, partial [Myxococcota bacterium]